MQCAEYQLKAATGGTFGIPGIARARYIPTTLRFSEELARLKFPALVAQCIEESISGIFRWRGMPLLRKFEDHYRNYVVAKQAAEASAKEALQSGVEARRICCAEP